MSDQARILVVEDDGAVRRAVERALTFEGYDVVTARDGRSIVNASLRR